MVTLQRHCSSSQVTNHTILMENFKSNYESLREICHVLEPKETLKPSSAPNTAKPLASQYHLPSSQLQKTKTSKGLVPQCRSLRQVWIQQKTHLFSLCCNSNPAEEEATVKDCGEQGMGSLSLLSFPSWSAFLYFFFFSVEVELWLSNVASISPSKTWSHFMPTRGGVIKINVENDYLGSTGPAVNAVQWRGEAKYLEGPHLVIKLMNSLKYSWESTGKRQEVVKE